MTTQGGLYLMVLQIQMEYSEALPGVNLLDTLTLQVLLYKMVHSKVMHTMTTQDGYHLKQGLL